MIYLLFAGEGGGAFTNIGNWMAAPAHDFVNFVRFCFPPQNSFRSVLTLVRESMECHVSRYVEVF